MSTQKKVTPDTAQLLAAAERAGKRGLPPVESWDPPFCGDLDMRIARDGVWYYLGSPIGRARLVKLFASILKREGDAYFLVTPVEKVGITVEDAPFVAVDFDVSGTGPDQALRFTTNVGDMADAGPDHPLRVAMDGDTPRPYVTIRRNLEALIDRKSFYRLVDLCVTHSVDGQDQFGLWSGGRFFSFIDSNELPD